MISWLAQTFGTREDGALVPPHNVEAEHRAARARRHGLTTGEGATTEGAVPAAFRPMLAALTERANDTSVAVVDMDPKGDGTSVSVTLTWAELNQQVNAAATRLHALGVRPGDRVNLMVPPGARLTTLIYAYLGRAGADNYSRAMVLTAVLMLFATMVFLLLDGKDED